MAIIKRTLIALGVLFLPGTTLSEPLIESVIVDKQLFILPAPKGYVSLKSTIPQLFREMESILPEEVNVLAFFVEDSFIANYFKDQDSDLSHYIGVFIPKEFENIKLTKETFSKIREKTKKRIVFNQRHYQVAKDMLKKLESDLYSKYQIEADLQVFKLIPLGIIHEDDYAIGYLDLVKSTITLESKREDVLQVVSTSLINVGRLMSVNIYKDYNQADDIRALKLLSKDWSHQIVVENKK